MNMLSFLERHDIQQHSSEFLCIKQDTEGQLDIYMIQRIIQGIPLLKKTKGSLTRAKFLQNKHL